jgi:hypothetical protein
MSQPFWLWLAPVLLWAAHRWCRVSGPHYALRLGLLLLACLALAGPRLPLGGRGMDVVLVFDESLSVDESARQQYRELAATAARRARATDRLAIVRFGSTVRIEKRLEDVHLPGEWSPLGQQHRSDIASAMRAALGQVPPTRPARVVVFTDGEFSREAAAEAARLASARQTPVDVWKIARPALPDISVFDMQLPGEVSPGAPFQFAAWLHSSAPATVRYELRRNGRPISGGTVQARAGHTPLLLRDVRNEEGLHGYELVVAGDGEDRVPQNNRARAVLRCRTQPQLLLVTHRPDGVWARVLDAYRLPHRVVSPPEAAQALQLEQLSGSLGVVLDNVNAEALGPDTMQAVRLYCQWMGGGLVMSGGREGFAMGGYFNSPIEDCLPVSLEVRKQIRKSRMSLVVALDRSGSMMAPAGAGLTKMDLANNGTIEAIKMLGPMDRVSVIAVDTLPHVIVPLSAVDDSAKLIAAVRRIRSEGGGIYVYNALQAAYQQLRKADTIVRHVILFSDAADSEQPGQYKELLAEMRAQNMTVSVIGLGTDRDVDANFLKDVAARGGGRIFFTERAEELPRLFSFETILADKSAYVENPIAIRQSQAGLAVLETLPRQLPAPALLAYNLGYPKARAHAAWVTEEDEPTALWAFGSAGLGRSSAVLFDVDGPDAAPLRAWDGFAGWLGALLRWTLASGGNPDAHLELVRDGHELVATLDMTAELQDQLAANPVLLVVPPGSRGEAAPVAFRQLPDGLWRAAFEMEETGLYHAAANLHGLGVLRAPPLVLPYSAEYRHWDPELAQERVQTILQATGGTVRTQFTDLFHPPRHRPVGLDLRPWLLGLLLAGWVLEISMRRLLYGAHWPAWMRRLSVLRPRRSAAAAPATPPQPTPAEAQPAPEPVAPADTVAGPPSKPDQPPVTTGSRATLEAMSKVKRKRR